MIIIIISSKAVVSKPVDISHDLTCRYVIGHTSWWRFSLESGSGRYDTDLLAHAKLLRTVSYDIVQYDSTRRRGIFQFRVSKKKKL